MSRKLQSGEPERIPIAGIRIDKETWKRFHCICIMEEKTIDQKLGELIKKEIEQNNK